jgi:vacuolar-type H+-ATPase catalytic subunit A/Vma1
MKYLQDNAFRTVDEFSKFIEHLHFFEIILKKINSGIDNYEIMLIIKEDIW